MKTPGMTMPVLRSTNIILVLVCQCFFLTDASFAHPASGIVIDAQRHVYFIYSGHGVMRIDPSGKLTNIHENKGGHWLALDAGGAFSQVKPKQFERITPDGTIPSLIFASGGAPLVVGPDGNLYYGSNGSREESFPPGAMAVVRLSASGQQELFAPLLKQKLAELHDGITGLASGPDGSIYVATWNGIVVLNGNGSIAKILHPVVVNDCDSDPADHNPVNASSPFLRGLGVDSSGNVYVAATSCHRVVKIAPDGQITSILKSERPWSPTGVAVRGEDIYVLEYTNANGSGNEGWYPRVRKRAMDGTWMTLVTVPPEIHGPLVASENPHYFKDTNGTALILTGSQTWNTLQDWGTDGSPQALDFDAFVKFLSAHGHNFTLLWTVELPKFCGLPTMASSPPDFTVSPLPYERTGPGTATDGGLKFDLTKFDQKFFDRLRMRTQALNNAGIYAGVYLFTGEFLNIFRCPTDGYPLTEANNINGVDDGYVSGKVGISAITMTAPNIITKFQDAYVEKVIDTLNDLPNVLWIVSEEAPSNSVWWNNHQISHIRAYESGKPHQHPIGYATLISAWDSIVYNSDADWVAPSVIVSPASSCGAGKPACKVNVNDSDHSYFGMWNETAQQNRNYAWENFTTGNQVLFMDPYLTHYPRENRNLCASPTKGICTAPDKRWDNFRDNLGYILRYSRKLNLVNVTARDSLCSTGYCLAQTPSAGAEYLVYAPSGSTFTVDLSAMPSSRTLAVEWFNPSNGATLMGNPISAGSSSQSFNPPFSADAVLYLVDTAGHSTESVPGKANVRPFPRRSEGHQRFARSGGAKVDARI